MAAKVIAKPIYVSMENNKRQIQEWAKLISSLIIGLLMAGL